MSSESQTTPEALRHLAVLAVTLSGLVLLTYVIPVFAGFRPWQNDWPLATLVRPAEQLYAFAGTGNAAQPLTDQDEERLAEDLGSSVAANLGSASAPRGHSIEIGQDEYAGIETFIEDPDSRGLEPFFEALVRTAKEEEGALTRVAHYGDSSIATDLITYTIRRNLQQRFGDGGHGFVLAADGYLAYRHRDIQRSANDEWIVREIVRSHDPAGLYGYGGVQVRTRPESWARYGTDDTTPVGGKVSRFEIWYQGYPHGGDLFYRVDAGERQVLETKADSVADMIETIDVPDGAHRLDLRFGGHGQSRLYGVVLERDGPGVVYDSLGLVGARAARLLNFDADHIASQIERRGTHLVVLGFGGNEADDSINQRRYEAEYRQVIQRMRAGREDLGCLVFAPLDQAQRSRFGHVRTMRTVPLIVEAQRAAARSEGCAFYDTWHAMGGEGSMGRWRRSRPRLAMSDLRHATPAGYEVIGNQFYKALLASFAQWLEAQAASH